MAGLKIEGGFIIEYWLQCLECKGIFQVYFDSARGTVVKACPYCGSKEAELKILYQDVYRPLPPELRSKIREVLKQSSLFVVLPE